MEQTPNHGLNRFEPGDIDWSHTPDMDTLEVAVPVRDQEDRLDAYDPHRGAKFEAIDTGREYVGTGEQWQLVPTSGSTPTFDSVVVAGADTRTSEPGANAKLEGPHAGIVHGEEYRSWAMQRALRAAITPHDRSMARVAFHFDGSNTQDYDDIFPAMRSRGLPWTNNLTADRLDASGRLTLSQAREMHAHGMEVGAYVHDEEVNSLREIESSEAQLETLLFNRRGLEDLGFNVSVLKGRHDAVIDRESLDAPISYAIRSSFACWTGSNHKPPHRSTVVAPMPDNHLNRGFNMEGASASEMIGHLERTVAVDGSTHFFAHANHATFEVDAFERLLDEVVRLRRRGALEVATVSGLLLMPYDLETANVVPDPTARGSAQFSVDDYWRWTRGSPRAVNRGGYVGSAHYELAAETGDQIGVFPVGLEPSYSTYTVDFQARAPPGERAEVRVTQRSQMGYDAYRGNTHSSRVGDRWTRSFAPFGLHREEGRMLVTIAAESGTVHLDDIKIYPT